MIKFVICKSINGDDVAWDQALASAQLAINTSISRRHGSTPFAVMFGACATDSKTTQPREKAMEELQ